MSSQAWLDYEVPGAPYFVLAERAILGEGVASTWQALASLISDAIEEEREAPAPGPAPAVVGRAPAGAARARGPGPCSSARCWPTSPPTG